MLRRADPPESHLSGELNPKTSLASRGQRTKRRHCMGKQQGGCCATCKPVGHVARMTYTWLPFGGCRGSFPRQSLFSAFFTSLHFTPMAACIVSL